MPETTRCTSLNLCSLAILVNYMRRIAIVCVLVAVLAAVWRPIGSPTTGTGSLTLPPPSPAPGESAPSFTHDRLNGDSFDLTERGVYVVTFLSTLNAYSNETRPAFARLAQEFSDSRVRFAAVYVGDPPRDAEAASHAVLHDDDGELAGLYRIKRVPRTFVIRDGQVYSVAGGVDAATPEDSRASLRELLT